MHRKTTILLRILILTVLAAAAVLVALDLRVSPMARATLAEPGSDPSRCLVAGYEPARTPRGSTEVTVTFTNRCSVALEEGSGTVLARDASAAQIEDGLTQIPALAPGGRGTDVVLLQVDPDEVAAYELSAVTLGSLE